MKQREGGGSVLILVISFNLLILLHIVLASTCNVVMSSPHGQTPSWRRGRRGWGNVLVSVCPPSLPSSPLLVTGLIMIKLDRFEEVFLFT